MNKNSHEAPGEIDPILLSRMLEAIEPVQPERKRLRTMRDQMLERVRGKTLPDFLVTRREDAIWVSLLPGVEVRPMRVDRKSGSQTSLWRLAPGASLPEHDHTEEEECLILEGSMEMVDKHYGPGDFLIARRGSHHTRFSSPDGAVLMIRGELSTGLEKAFAQAGF